VTTPATCPGCGALVGRQLTRCRHCNRYLHGTKLEGALFGSMPGPLAQAPGTGLMVLVLVGYWLAMVAATRFDGVLAFSGYSLQQFGSMVPTLILSGQPWRFVTSMLGHHDLVHLAFNLWALTIAGAVVEKLYGRHKAWMVFVIAGVLSMMASFGWNVWLSPDPARIVASSIGASGAVSGLIGAGLVGARRLRLDAAVKALGRWVLYLAVFGILVPGIDNAAHAGGFLAGAALGALLPLGMPASHTLRRVWSVATLATLVGLLACAAIGFNDARHYPTVLARDASPNKLFGFTITEPVAWEASTQRDALGACARAVEQHADAERVRERCDFALRAVPSHPTLWRVMQEHAAAHGDGDAARRYEDVADRLDAALEGRR
jgi:membrane associated rhomboid family serine protease